jgi:3-isopropylmalate/(R)-2-methylmalate dehydratase small subunit
MKPYTAFTASTILVPIRDIDTDQIIPARFLKVTDKLGLGDKLFCDWRYDDKGAPRPEFPLNEAGGKGAQVLVAGDNFGCGSSREHAPWALTDWGFRAVVSTGFADIFRQNALKNGLLPIEITVREHENLVAQLQGTPNAAVSIDLAAERITFPKGDTASFPIDAFAKKCLLEGIDQLGYLLRFEAKISAFEGSR